MNNRVYCVKASIRSTQIRVGGGAIGPARSERTDERTIQIIELSDC